MIVCALDDMRPLTANDVSRASWRSHHDRKAAIRDAAWDDARARRGRRPRLTGPFIATLIVTPPDRRRRDLDGFAPTLKRMLDATVMAGVIEDDSARIVSEVRIRTRPPAGQWRLELHLDPATQKAA